MCLRRSITNTRLPLSDNSRAHTAPNKPAPTIRKSYINDPDPAALLVRLTHKFLHRVSINDLRPVPPDVYHAVGVVTQNVMKRHDPARSHHLPVSQEVASYPEVGMIGVDKNKVKRRV